MTAFEDYLTAASAPHRAELEKIRKLVHTEVPTVEELLSYSMAGFKYKKKYLLALGSFKDHMSVFPGAITSEKLLKELKAGGYKLAKGTIQFTVDHPLPESMLKEIIKLRVSQIDRGVT